MYPAGALHAGGRWACLHARYSYPVRIGQQTHCFNFCNLTACEALWFRPGGLICDWRAAVIIHIHIQHACMHAAIDPI